MNNKINNILLLGAGFTKNFGGFLAYEIVDYIFNQENIQENPEIREKMSDNFNYEELWQEFVLDSNNDTNKNIFKEAVEKAYKYQDDNLKMTNANKSLEIRKFNHSFIKDLFIDKNDKTFIFTLNQDLFFERFYRPGERYKLEMPGVRVRIRGKNGEEDRKSLETTIFADGMYDEVYFEIGNKEELEKISIETVNKFSYVKLHGSKNFPTDMIIGTNKLAEMNKQPLIKAYYDLFGKVLAYDNSDKKKLLIIGYGFRDKHINEEIFNNIDKLKLYIINPQPRESFYEELKKNSISNEINLKDKMSGYFQYNLLDIFHPYDTSEQYKRIQEVLSL